MKKSMIAESVASAFTAMADAVPLPPPVRTGGLPVADALAARRSVRDYDPRDLTTDELSSLLWAAAGVNRPDGRRTAPTGLNVQDIDVYVMCAAGVSRYDAAAHGLVLVNPGDHRAVAGCQAFASLAPVNLFYVQDTTRAMKADAKNMARHGGIHAGAIMQNVYLHCAAQGLGTVVRDNIDRDALAKVLKLKPPQQIVIAQSVGARRADGLIGEEAARRAALAAAGLGVGAVRRISCELDRAGGVAVYEVAFTHDGSECAYAVDARTGAVRGGKKTSGD